MPVSFSAGLQGSPLTPSEEGGAPPASAFQVCISGFAQRGHALAFRQLPCFSCISLARISTRTHSLNQSWTLLFSRQPFTFSECVSFSSIRPRLWNHPSSTVDRFSPKTLPSNQDPSSPRLSQKHIQSRPQDKTSRETTDIANGCRPISRATRHPRGCPVLAAAAAAVAVVRCCPTCPGRASARESTTREASPPPLARPTASHLLLLYPQTVQTCRSRRLHHSCCRASVNTRPMAGEWPSSLRRETGRALARRHARISRGRARRCRTPG